MNIEQLREQAIKLCTDHGVAVRPYAGAWWLIGNGINRVVAELAGLCQCDIKPLVVAER